MKIAVLSDIHGNAFALKAVLADAQTHGVDVMVNLGDIFYGPIAPRATYELLTAHDIVTIRGNQDRLIIDATAGEREANPTLGFVIDDLGDAPLDWIKTLPGDLPFTDAVYLCHGSPASDMEYLLEDIDAGSPRLRSDRRIQELLDGVTAEMILCGHTHIPRTVALSSGQQVVNPGSVGLPAYTDELPRPHAMENFSPHAAYAVIERVSAGWTVQHIRVAYDHRRAAESAAGRQRGDWARFLATGRG